MLCMELDKLHKVLNNHNDMLCVQCEKQSLMIVGRNVLSFYSSILSNISHQETVLFLSTL